MVKIEAVIHSDQLYPVLTALHQIEEMPAFTVTEVRGYPHGHGATRCGSEGTDAINSVDRMKVECVVPEAMAGLVMNTIGDAVHDTSSSKGKLVAYEVKERAHALVGVRNGDSDPDIGPGRETR